MSSFDFDAITVTKLVVVFYIIMSCLFDFNKKLTFLDNKLSKIILLMLVLIVLYHDLHLGILLVIAFLMLNIQLNVPIMTAMDAKMLERFLSSQPDNVDTVDTNDKIIHKTIAPCDNEKKNEISQNILDYSIDTKVKPYEVFIKLMTTKDHLDSAANSAFLL